MGKRINNKLRFWILYIIVFLIAVGIFTAHGIHTAMRIYKIPFSSELIINVFILKLEWIGAFFLISAIAIKLVGKKTAKKIGGIIG